MKSKAYSFRCSLLFIFTLTLILFPASTFSATIKVPTDQPTIQAGIDAASDGDTVSVADGTYTGEGNKNLDFRGKAITVQSEKGAVNTIIDCEGVGRAFYFHSGEGEDSVVSGFTVINGRMYRAGGISCENSSPTIRECIMSGNVADDANSGGIGCYNSSPTIIDCTIIGNSADMWGGGIGCFDSSPTIENCIIGGNESEHWWGGGIVSYNSTLNITNSIISRNSANREGGGIYLNSSSAIIMNCTFSENMADEGGGIYSAYSSNPLIINTILWSDYPDEISVFSADVFVSYSVIEKGWIGEGNVDINPALLDPANGDYRLKNYSPCIGAGTSIGAPNTDIEGNPRPNPAGSYPDMGAYENSRGTRSLPPLGIFALEVANKWNYEGTKQGNPYTVEREVNRLDQTTFSPDTYVFEIKEDGVTKPGEWYEKKPGEIGLWAGGGYRFSAGLLAAWYPMQVGDHRKTSANVVGFSGVSVSLTVDVLSKGPVTLAFDTLEAYELRYQLVTSGPGGTVTDTFRWWMVPYIGVVKDQRADSVVKLTSFAVGGGTITQDTDADGDGLKDYEEHIIYSTNLLDSDTDNDGMPDGWELTYGLDPLDDQDANEDSDQDGYTNLKEYQKDTDPNDPKSHPSTAMPWIPLLLLEDRP